MLQEVERIAIGATTLPYLLWQESMGSHVDTARGNGLEISQRNLSNKRLWDVPSGAVTMGGGSVSMSEDYTDHRSSQSTFKEQQTHSKKDTSVNNPRICRCQAIKKKNCKVTTFLILIPLSSTLREGLRSLG